MKIKHFVIIITLLVAYNCAKQPEKLRQIEAKQININDSLSEISEIEEFIKPKRAYIKADLGKILCYNPYYLGKTAPNLNTALGNLMADIVYEQANPIFKERTGANIDFVLLNYGGIRATIPEGDVTTKTAFEVMPFENTILVAELSYEKLEELKSYLIENQKAHPVSKQFHLELNNNKTVKSFTINKKTPEKNKTYYVATSNFLLGGGDHMDFFKDTISVTPVDYLLRKAMIDYFAKTDTLQTSTDKRFYIN